MFLLIRLNLVLSLKGLCYLIQSFREQICLDQNDLHKAGDSDLTSIC